MTLIAPNVARFSVVGRLNGQEIINIVDVTFDGLIGPADRESGCFEIAGDILNNWDDHILSALVNDYTAEEVRWVDLDSPDGSTGARSTTSAETWPKQGSNAASPLPNNVTIRCRKNLQGSTRSTRRGEMRLAGADEGWTGPDGITLTPAVVSDLNGRLEDFKDGINGTGGSPVYTRNICQVHTVDGAWTATSILSTYEVIPVVGTQRRRMPGYGS